MNTKKFSEAMNQVGDKYYEEALDYRKNAAKPVWARWGTEQIGNVRGTDCHYQKTEIDRA